MRFTVVVFGEGGRAARSLRAHAGVLLGAIALTVVALSAVMLLGWSVGEITARL